MKHRINRRQFLKQTILGVSALKLNLHLSCSNAVNQKRPNIFLAIADDWSWPHASIYGDKAVKTPTFDNIAKNGLLFNNAFVSAPSCTPSRSAILTGQHFWRLGEGANLWSRLPLQHKTYPNILEDNGYYVGSCLKGWRPGKNRKRNEVGPNYHNFKEFLEKKPKNKSFCFWYGSYDPHRSYEWQSGIRNGINSQEVSVPPFLPDNQDIRTDICDYYWEVQRFDKAVGKQIKLIEKAGELENTLLIITSDNGWPFPRCKCNLYNYGTHVPLAIQWPNKIKKAQIIEDFVSLTDLTPTFLEIAGVEIPADMTGNSLMNIFERDELKALDSSREYILIGRERHTPAQSDHMGGYPMRAIRNKNFLYIRNFKPDRWPAGEEITIRGPAYSDIDASPTKSYIIQHRNHKNLARFFNLACGKRPFEELYNLRDDPYELNNVADDPNYRDVLKSLRNQLMTQLRLTQDPRVLGNGDIFDKFPYYGPMENKQLK